MNQKTNWTFYNQSKSSFSPRPILVETLKQFSSCSELMALDLGCGSGRDSIELLKNNFKVDAVDGDSKSLDLIPSHPNLRKICSKFEDLHLEANKYALINASFALPFCHPNQFEAFLQKLLNSLISGGWFCGQFFGVRDGWNAHKHLTFHSKDSVQEILRYFQLENFKEHEFDGPTFGNKQKHWHYFEFIAKKLEP